jgi:hypothetical protein
MANNPYIPGQIWWDPIKNTTCEIHRIDRMAEFNRKIWRIYYSHPGQTYNSGRWFSEGSERWQKLVELTEENKGIFL